MPSEKARFATVHWMRFASVMTPEHFPVVERPGACIGWKIGWDGPLGGDGMRLPSEVWCAVALFADAESGRSALSSLDKFLPFASQAVECWHALLLPVTHRGACNHLDRDDPGLIFEPARSDPGGPVLVMTTAGFDLGPTFDLARVVDFRQNVDRVRQWMGAAPGFVVAQVLTPQTRGDDGVTMSLWSDDSTMASVMYGPGAHRTQLDRYRKEKTADRTSFTRLRVLETSGTWHGVDPLDRARQTGGRGGT